MRRRASVASVESISKTNDVRILAKYHAIWKPVWKEKVQIYQIKSAVHCS